MRCVCECGSEAAKKRGKEGREGMRGRGKKEYEGMREQREDMKRDKKKMGKGGGRRRGETMKKRK